MKSYTTQEEDKNMALRFWIGAMVMGIFIGIIYLVIS